MEHIVFGLVLFIVAVGLTFIYDHVKAQTAKSREFRNDFRAAMKPTAKPSKSKESEQVDKLISELKVRSQLGHTHVKGQFAGQSAQTYTVPELIKKLEEMKKKI